MEKVFESYVAKEIMKNVGEEYEVSTQDRSKYLLFDFEKNENKLNMKPDIVIKKGKEVNVLDTKWKVIDINSEKSKKGISPSDLYQMYAYGKKYKANKLILIFPENENFNKIQTYKYDDETTLHIFPWNLSKENVGKNIEAVLGV
jgi:5-methylcytosine-specific restriction enzyme subunit McrC